MKIQAIILILCLTGMAFGESSKLKSTLTTFLNMKASAVDAVDAALGVLNDLKQQNVDAQNRADDLNRTQEAELGRQIQQLTSIADQNKASGDSATEHRKFTEGEIQVTQENLVWINRRRGDIHKQRDNFREHRCYSSLQFVKQLKEHDEAITVINWLKEDVLGIVSGAQSGEAAFAQITDSAKKLEAYAHLFNEAALKDFAQLTQSRHDVDAATGEWNADADDNNRDALSVERMGAGTAERDVGNKLLQSIERLRQHLEDSMEHLKKSEIQSAWDLVKWLQGTEEELEQLDKQQEEKTAYIDRLLVAIVGAKAREDQAWEIYFESATTLNDALHAREEKRSWYAQEKARRDEENLVLDEVISIFVERVSSIDKGIRNKVNDFSVDGIFDDSDIKRSADDHLARDGGRLQQNLDSETRF